MVSLGKTLLYAGVIMLSSFEFGYIFNFPAPASEEIHKRFNMSENDIRWSIYNSSLCVGGFIMTFFVAKIVRLCKE